MYWADGDSAGLNFLSCEAIEAYEERVAYTPVGVDPFRTRRHLMASQTLAFNLFGHLSRHLDLATELFRMLLFNSLTAVETIEIERLSAALGDRTAFDAFVRCETSDGPACIAIETKLTEPFSQREYDWAAYAAHTAFDPAVWITTDLARLGDRRWSQLWRNHLLGRAECAAMPELGGVTVLVVHHPMDPHCKLNVDSYRSLLTTPDDVRAVDLQQITDALTD